MKKLQILVLILSLVWCTLSACAPRHLDYGHRENYWKHRGYRERKPTRYYYPDYNPENRARQRYKY